MQENSTAHLVYGPTAAGKSTYARRLAADNNAVRFAVDEWMHALYGADVPATLDMSWVMPRVARCQSLIWAISAQILDAGTDVVLEAGLLQKIDRDRALALVKDSGHMARLCFVDADLAARRQRVLKRNSDKGDTYSFEVTPTMFDAMEGFFERPGTEELRRSVVVPEEHLHG